MTARLHTLLDGVIQFGVVSIGTAKKVIRSVRSEHPGIKMLRPLGVPGQSIYVTPRTSPKLRSYVESMYAHGDLKKGSVKSHSIILPRGTPELRQAYQEGAKMGLSMGDPKTLAIRRRAMKMRSDVLHSTLAPALHEHGHVSMPSVTRVKMEKAQKEALSSPFGLSLTNPIGKLQVEEELRANRDIKDRIAKYGTKAEVKKWTTHAQKQMKVGYRNPIFSAATMEVLKPKDAQVIGQLGHLPLSIKRKAVTKFPWVRRQELASMLDGLIQFRARWEDQGWQDNPLYPEDVKSTVQHVPIKNIISHQNAVKGRIVKKYREKSGRDLPMLHKVGSKYFVEDGNHRIVAKMQKGEKTIRARVFEKNELSSILDDLIEFKLHQPSKEDEPPEELPVFKEGQILDYNVQRHQAKRAGLHRDVRIGNPRSGLLSWATRKEMPGHGEKIAIHQQPTHRHSYLGWEGEIPSGYGAGTVKSEDLGKALVTRSSPQELHATLAERKGSHRLAFVKTKSGWLLSKAKQPQPPAGAQKPPAKSLPPEEAKGYLSKLEPGSSVQPKVDGALVYVTTRGGRPEILSHRISKTTHSHPVHTERVFRGRPTIDIPREHQRSLAAELYEKVRGKAIPPQELGGILNRHIGESIHKQKESGVKLKVMPFDLAGNYRQGGNYSERLEKVKQTLKYLPRDTFHAPEEATTPQAALRLYEKIRSGKHPLTKEGIIIHPPQGKMIKVKHTKEANVNVHSTFAGEGKFRGGPGGFIYSDSRGNPVGRVGTGFTDETRKDLDKYIGRTARIKHQGQYKSGAYRAPSFIAIEENK